MVKKSLMVFASLCISTSIFCGWITSTVDHTVARPVDAVTENGKNRRENRRENREIRRKERKQKRKDRKDKKNKPQEKTKMTHDDMGDSAMGQAGY
jgi:mannitol-specific phosphotransferase system IIBC component